jgi:SAM-dependent methyltransferase
VSTELAEHESAWRTKGLLRRVYGDWYRLIASRLSSVPGETVELGSGIGRIKEAIPSAVTTDVEPTPWADRVVDAEQLPFEAGSVANLVLLDVFHHLARPAAFLAEATRVLPRGGRIVLLEPYCSPLSTIAYRHVHHEDIDLEAAPLAEDDSLADSPWTANLGRSTLAFFRNPTELAARFPQLELVERRRLSLFVYVLSGGYSRRPLAPGALYRPLAAAERLLAPLLPLAAFRCLVVLERT